MQDISMPMTAEQFVDLLENRGVLQPVDIESLREQVAASTRPMHPVFIARRLVQAGFINAYFAKTLLTEGAKLHGGDDQDSLEVAAGEMSQGTAGGTEEIAELDGLKLMPIGDVDLLSQSDTDDVSELPSTLPKSGLAAVFARNTTWKVTTLRQQRLKRWLTIAAVAFVVLLIALLVYVAISR